MAREIVWFPPGCDPSAPDGTEIILSGDPLGPFTELVGASGYGAADWLVTWNMTPGVDGATLGETSSGVRDLRWRFLLEADTRREFVDAYHRLVAATHPKRGLGVFRVGDATQSAAGLVREVRAVCVGGLRGDETLARGEDVTEWPFDLVMQASDPYWYSTKPITASWSGLPATPFFPFTLPWSPSRSGVTVVDVLDVRGDADSWPSFDLRGPFTRVRVTAAEGTHFWEVTRPTSASEMLRLVTKPGDESLRLLTSPDGVAWSDQGSRWGALHPDSWFTPLRFRDQVTVDVDGTSDETRVELSAFEAWNTAP